MAETVAQEVYDDFTAPELHPERWNVAAFRGPDGELSPCMDRNAVITTGDGALHATIRPFSRFHDAAPILNNPKLLYLSTRRFETPPGSITTFETDLAITTF